MTHWAQLPTDRITAALRGDTPMVISCPECEHGSKIARIYARTDEIRVVFHSDTCGCVLSQIDQLRLAASVLRQQAVEMERNVVEVAPV
jgi:hypothetical protein